MTKFTYIGHAPKDLAELPKNHKALRQARSDPKAELAVSTESVKLNLRKAAQETQKLAEPRSRKHHQFVAEKIRRLKEIIAKGEYEIDPREVAKRMISAANPRHREKRKARLINLDLTELLALRRKRHCGEKNDAATWENNKTASQHGPSSRFTNKSLHNPT